MGMLLGMERRLCGWRWGFRFDVDRLIDNLLNRSSLLLYKFQLLLSNKAIVTENRADE
jgi:hypothetical protein